MNFRKKLMTVLQKLGLVDKAKSNTLTNEDWQNIVNSYRLEYQASLRDDMAASEAPNDPNVPNVPNAPALTQEELNSI
jgi:Tfp pilus assembly protein PilN